MGWGHFDPRDMIGRIYVELHMTLMHTEYTSCGPCGFREENFIMYFYHKPMEDNDAPVCDL